MTLFVDLLLPLHLPDTYTYRVPQEYNDSIKVGQRVIVQFGSKRLYSALVRRIHEEVPSYRVKYILSILDQEPIVDEMQFKFWEWIASYYMCYPGDVMAIALPAALRLASESTVSIHPDFSGEIGDLTDKEMRVVQLLMEHPVMTLDDLQRAIATPKMLHIINTMVERGIVIMNEELHDRYKPRTSSWITLAPQYKEEEACKKLFDSLEQKASTRKQLDVLLRFMQLSHFGEEAISKKKLIEQNVSVSSLNTLIKNQILQVEERNESRLRAYSSDEIVSPEEIQLNEEQAAAFHALNTSATPVSLLHGVTSSGKTEVYIKLIHHTLKQGKQVLFLLPEIALTAQLINRLRRYFGDLVGIYHSRFSQSQRAEVWSRTSGHGAPYSILVGARSALFLPFKNLGLIIVDEEHDSSFKQNDPAPRYNGRDAAIMLARYWNARIILGSATPSIESYFQAQNGRYQLVEMKHRFGGLEMPEILCADMREATKKKEVQGHFSKFLIDHIAEALSNHEQVILFQNRRGFSLRIECDDCHYVPQCQHCDVSLVYHKNTHSLRCHYCGYSIPVPSECPACHSTHLTMKGFGTERIEEDLAIMFPNAHIARMDLDSTMQKNQHAQIISDFEDGSIDILVGTQMVTKGLDFNNVSVVGILSADNLVAYPDFRAYERAFQQMTQVSGRAGRHGHRGKVIIQAYNPWHQAIRDVIDNNYANMYGSQIIERRVFSYPPYHRLIEITLRHRDSDSLNEASASLASRLRQVFGTRVIGPEYPSVPRVRGLYIKNILMRFERSESLGEAKRIILEQTNQLLAEKPFKSVRIAFDVDPQ